MRAQTRSKEADRLSARQRRAERAAQSKLNRAQLRAMEVRRAETLAPEPEDLTASAAADGTGVVAATMRTRTAASMSRRVIARPVALTKQQEYAFIRTDLRRLAITAGLLFVMMVVLLFIVEA